MVKDHVLTLEIIDGRTTVKLASAEETDKRTKEKGKAIKGKRIPVVPRPFFWGGGNGHTPTQTKNKCFWHSSFPCNFRVEKIVIVHSFVY